MADAAPVERTALAILRWHMPLRVSLVRVTYVPQISLWLLRQFMSQNRTCR